MDNPSTPLPLSHSRTNVKRWKRGFNCFISKPTWSRNKTTTCPFALIHSDCSVYWLVTVGFVAKITLCPTTNLRENILSFLPGAAQTRRPSVSEGVFVCGIKVTDVSGFLYERLRADSLIEMHVYPKQPCISYYDSIFGCQRESRYHTLLIK